jgi:hypothetical protein
MKANLVRNGYNKDQRDSRETRNDAITNIDSQSNNSKNIAMMSKSVDSKKKIDHTNEKFRHVSE